MYFLFNTAVYMYIKQCWCFSTKMHSIYIFKFKQTGENSISPQNSEF